MLVASHSLIVQVTLEYLKYITVFIWYMLPVDSFPKKEREIISLAALLRGCA